MSYNCYLFGELMPQTPAKLSVKIKGQNKTVTLLDEGEINLLKYPGLTEISLSLTFPMLSAEKRPDYYLSLLERAKTRRQTTQFLLTRSSPSGVLLYDTNLKVSVEDYTTNEAATTGLDVSVDIKLKQYRDYGTQTITFAKSSTASASETQTASEERTSEKAADTASAAQAFTIEKERAADTAPTAQTYTVKHGDTLWSIAKTYYGNGAAYATIYEANKTVIQNPNRIFAGQVLTIP